MGVLGSSGVAGLLLGGKAAKRGIESLIPVPEIPAPAPPPKVEDKAVQEAAAEAARRRSRARGYRATILSEMVPQPEPGRQTTLGS